MIYADNAATTRIDIEVFEAMKPFILEEFGNPSQPYSFSKNTKLALKDSREKIARCINAKPENIFFTSGGTESDNWVIKEFGDPLIPPTIITSEIEHHAILNSCKYMKEKKRASVKYLNVNPEGMVSEEDLERLLKNESDLHDSSTLVSVMAANNEIGTIQNIKALSKVTHKYGASFHTDAVQAVGHITLDVKDLEVDYLSASAHKFNGPRGIGFLYSNCKNMLSDFHSGGMQEFGMRAGTEDVASIVGMAKALEMNCLKICENEKKIRKLEKDLLDRIKDLKFKRNGSENCLPGILSLSFPGFEGETLLHRLDLMGICVSTGSACDSVNTEISHVLKAINLEEDYAMGTIRISIGKNNSEQDIIDISEALHRIIGKK